MVMWTVIPHSTGGKGQPCPADARQHCWTEELELPPGYNVRETLCTFFFLHPLGEDYKEIARLRLQREAKSLPSMEIPLKRRHEILEPLPMLMELSEKNCRVHRIGSVDPINRKQISGTPP